MDIPYEKLSVKEAKDALDRHDAAAPPAPEQNWFTKRKVQGAEKVKVNKDVMAWLSQLPQEVRPRALAIQYPRIFNKIVELWARQLLCEKYLDDLLMDDRGARQGFPEDVAVELTALRNHFLLTTKTTHVDVWGERVCD